MLYRILETFLKMSPLKWDLSQSPKLFIAREFIDKLQRYQSLDFPLLQNLDALCCVEFS